MCRNKRELSCKFPENVLLIKEADINEIVEVSDVVVTILSTAAYTSLIRKKATVMLGYTQFKDKGCTYEAYERDMIEDMLVQAVNEGFSKQKQEYFLKHLAQMNKYYLYNDLREKTIQYVRI